MNKTIPAPDQRRAFTLIEILVVVGIIAILVSILFPVYHAHVEGARIQEMQAQFRLLESALAQYQRQWGEYPSSSGGGDNSGSESLIAALRSTARGGPFLLRESTLARWLGDTDADGRPEFLDPWKDPWIYFHSFDYAAGAVYYRLKDRRVEVEPAKKGDLFKHLTSYQLWAAGPNRTDESKFGYGDDCGNVRQ